MAPPRTLNQPSRQAAKELGREGGLAQGSLTHAFWRIQRSKNDRTDPSQLPAPTRLIRGVSASYEHSVYPGKPGLAVWAGNRQSKLWQSKENFAPENEKIFKMVGKYVVFLIVGQ